MDKTCTHCNEQFQVTDKHKAFYARMDVPAPTFCPACRQQRRLTFRNERTLYPRSCDMCKKSIIAIYPAETQFPVYCHTCWWSDAWDGTIYGMDWDSSRPFFDQYSELQSKVPRISILSIDSENSDYTNNSANNKNSYLIFAAENNEDCYYGRLVQHCNTCVDCDNIYDSEKCYGCIDCRNCYSTLFSEKSSTCNDVLFGFGLSGCSNCILCTNLRNKEYYIENKPVSKEEFEKKKKEILSSSESLELARTTFEEMKRRAVVKYADITKCENSSGEYLFNCHDTEYSFDTTNGKDSAFVNDALDPIDFYDANNVYYKPELCYDIMGALKIYNCICSTYIFYASNLAYCGSCTNTTDSFGCIGLKKNQYCILNKQYTKEEYEVMRKTIVEQMKQEGAWGEFFPSTLSPFAYNETHAMTYFPLDRKQVNAYGWRWSDSLSSTYGKETVKPEPVPRTIEEVPDTITKELLACVHCGRNYRITSQELAFYRLMHLPLPLMAPECRLLERQSHRNPRQLWERTCTCAGSASDNGLYTNTVSHDHGDNQCPNTFETAYAPDRPEIIYCEVCYQKEVL